MSITRKCASCGDPVLRSNSGAPNRRCASCQRRRQATCRDLDPKRIKTRQIKWFLEHGPKDRRVEIEAFLSKPVEGPKPVGGPRPESIAEITAAIQATKIAEFLKANGGPRGYTPLTEAEKIAQMARFKAERKARGQLMHEQNKAILLQQGAVT